MSEAWIFDHVRTPRGRGRPDGALHGVTPVELLAQVLAALRDRNDLDTTLLDDVVIGCVSPVGEQGADIARIAALMADYGTRVPGQQLNRLGASGLEAVNTAAALIMAGQADLTIGGGVESMSRIPMGSDGGAWSSDPQVAWRTHYIPQGIGADLIATLEGFSREEVDCYALESSRRAMQAWKAGHFKHSVVPVLDGIGDVLLAHDEHLHPIATLEDLSRLPPALAVQGRQGGFDAVALLRHPGIEAIEHVHTDGNSGGIADGAAAVLIGSHEMGERLGLRPRARIRGFASIGSEPTIMLTGLAPAAYKALRRAGMTVTDIDLFEINEAFSSVVLSFMRELGLSHERINVNGGAITLGHPLGATGAMILGTVLDELERCGLSTALVGLCAGAGMGTATIIERI